MEHVNFLCCKNTLFRFDYFHVAVEEATLMSCQIYIIEVKNGYDEKAFQNFHYVSQSVLIFYENCICFSTSSILTEIAHKSHITIELKSPVRTRLVKAKVILLKG